MLSLLDYMQESQKIGVVITDGQLPSQDSFQFVVVTNQLESVQQGRFIQVNISDTSILVGRIVNIAKTNRYFARADSIRHYERGGNSLSSLLPVQDWEFCIATAKTLGIQTERGIERSKLPVSPGDSVAAISPSVLHSFLSLDPSKGLNLGNLVDGSDARINLTRLLQKHLAILAISGGGKSYLTSVLIEELLSRPPSLGSPCLVIFDVHGEYTYLGHPSSSSNPNPFTKKVSLFEGYLIRFATSRFSASRFARFLPDISPIQIRELNRILLSIHKDKKNSDNLDQSYNLDDLVSAISTDMSVASRTREALLGWFLSLSELPHFSDYDYPNLRDVLEPGKAIIIDLSNLTSMSQKQMIVSYLIEQTFYLRKENLVPPTTFILEEAHQFCPEGGKFSSNLSKPIIETVAREGRKFLTSLILISQRPVKLATTALSQCNSQLIMRMVNPYDLEYIGRSSEGIDKDSLRSITNLGVGECILTGNAVNHPIFLNIRKKLYHPDRSALDLEQSLKQYAEIQMVDHS